MLEKVDEVIRTARELEGQIKRRMAESARHDQPAGNWSDRRHQPERRRRSRWRRPETSSVNRNASAWRPASFLQTGCATRWCERFRDGHSR